MKYDIIIAGGGTAGCACAYIAGKSGLKVLLVEKNSFLGGSITSSLVIPAMKTSSNAINTEFFDTLYKKLHAIGGAITYMDGNKGWFNPELTKIVLDEMMHEANVEVLFESSIRNIKGELSSYIVTLCVNNSISFKEELSLPIETSYLVDATGDAKICQKLNCEGVNEGVNPDINKIKTQPVNLRFIMSGVNIEEFSAWIIALDSDRDVTTSCTLDGRTYLSTAYTWDSGKKWALEPLFKQGIAEGVITEADSNYFQVFSVAGTSDSISFNAPRLIKSTSNPYVEGRAAILRISNFCKKYLKGFENAYISSIANSLGVRVSNRVKGKYVYTSADLRSGKKFKNPVVISNYPIDIHSDKKDNSKLEKVYQEYQLPIESLIVKDRLFVIGQSNNCCFSGMGIRHYSYRNIFKNRM